MIVGMPAARPASTSRRSSPTYTHAPGATRMTCAACSSGAGCGFACGVVSPDTTTRARGASASAATTGSVKRVCLLVTMPHGRPRASMRVEQRVDAVEQARRLGEAVRVVREERLAHRVVVRVPGRDAHARLQQAPRAGRRVRAQAVHRHRRQAGVRAHAIERQREIARGIGERSVEVEEDGGDRQRPRRGVSRHARACGTRRCS